MIVTLDWIAKKFDVFNELYFDGKLQRCGFKVSASRCSWGQCCWKYSRHDNKVVSGSELIKISKFFDVPEQHLEETLIHEMIHLKFIQDNRPKVCHGPQFIREARRITSQGRHRITVTDSSVFNVNQEVCARRRRTFKVITFKNLRDGEMWFMTAAADANDQFIQKIIEKVNCKYPYYKIVGMCLSDHDMFVGCQATIKSFRWSIRKFLSASEYHSMWDSATNKRQINNRLKIAG